MKAPIFRRDFPKQKLAAKTPEYCLSEKANLSTSCCTEQEWTAMSSDSTEDNGEEESLKKSQLAAANSSSETTVSISKQERNDAQEMKQGHSPDKNNGKSANEQKDVTSKNHATSWFAIPAPLKRLFDHFPLVTYSESQLPTRAFKTRSANDVLHVFTNERDAANGRPSFNPSCLKWQVRTDTSHLSELPGSSAAPYTD